MFYVLLTITAANLAGKPPFRAHAEKERYGGIAALLYLASPKISGHCHPLK